jgi:hypothetical protein
MEMDMMCRRTLLGHKDDVVSLSALGLRRRAPEPAPGAPGAGAAAAVVAGAAAGAMLAALVASASADGSVRVWCAPNWTCLKVLIASPPLAAAPLPLAQAQAPLLVAAATAPLPPRSPTAAGGHGRSPLSAASSAAAPAPAAAAPPPAHSSAAAPPDARLPPAVPHGGVLQRPPPHVAPVRIGHSSFASFDFSGDDFSFGGSHASRAPLPGGPAAPAAHAAPAQQQVGFVVDGRGGAGGAPAAAAAAAHAHAHTLQQHVLASPAAPAALCVAVARGVIAAGFVDGGVRLWHVDELCGAAAEAVGRCLPSTPPPGTMLEGALSMSGGCDLQTFLSHPGGAGGLLGTSPPASPHGPPALRADGSAAGGPPLASSGSGGFGLAAADRGSGPGAAAGCVCARVRAGSWAADGDGGAATAAPPAHCAACGSMDQQLVRALKELVAIRTVSSSQVGVNTTGRRRPRVRCWRAPAYLLTPRGARMHTLTRLLTLQPPPARNCGTSACGAPSTWRACWRASAARCGLRRTRRARTPWSWGASAGEFGGQGAVQGEGRYPQSLQRPNGVVGGGSKGCAWGQGMARRAAHALHRRVHSSLCPRQSEHLPHSPPSPPPPPHPPATPPTPRSCFTATTTSSPRWSRTG